MPNYTVLPGDTLGQIAKKMNVPVNTITGYKSGNPNIIFPGEQLTFGQPTPVQTPAPAPVQAQNPVLPTGNPTSTPPVAQAVQPAPQALAPAAPQAVQPDPNAVFNNPSFALGDAAFQQPVAPVQPVAQAPVMTQGAPQTQALGTQASTQVQPPVGQQAQQDELFARREQLLQELAQQDPELADQVMDSLGYTGSTASREVSAEDQKLQQADAYFNQFGIPASALQESFQTNPSGTLSDLIRLVMEQTGMPDARANVASLSKEIEDLSNERDREIAKVGDDPFTSSGTKSALGQKIEQQYELRIKNRVNTLTLMQNAYEDAQEQARFAATTAISLFNQDRNFKADQIEKAMSRAERQAEAERKIAQDEKPIEVSAGASLFDPKTRERIFTAPQKASAGSSSGTTTSTSGTKFTPGTKALGSGGATVTSPRSEVILSPLAAAWVERIQKGEGSVNQITGAANIALKNEVVMGLQGKTTLTDEQRQLETKRKEDALTYYNQANLILTDPSLKMATGKSGAFVLPFTKAKYIKDQISQIKSAIELNSRAKLKGQGTITDREMEILSKASTAMNGTLTEEAMIGELKKVRGALAFLGGIKASINLIDPNTGQSIGSVMADSLGYRKAIEKGLLVEFN